MPRAQRIAGKKQAKRLNAIGRQKLKLALMKKKEPLIPTRLLKALADSHLPNDPQAYTERLRELLGAQQ